MKKLPTLKNLPNCSECHKEKHCAQAYDLREAAQQ